MATASSNQLYPFSTEDNKAIPLDIIRPLALIRKSVLSGSLASLTIPADWLVASFYSPSGCIIQFVDTSMPSSLADGVSYSNCLLVPPNCVVTATVLPGAAKAAGLGSASYVIIQQVQKWAGLALQRQLSKV